LVGLGGPAILNAVEKQLELAPHKLDAARQVLRDYGNISSSTCIYVLDYMRQQSLKLKEANGGVNTEPEWGLILAFGPGVTIEGSLARNLC
jgi:predicted naringenin-chalcone synthase